MRKRKLGGKAFAFSMAAALAITTLAPAMVLEAADDVVEEVVEDSGSGYGYSDSYGEDDGYGEVTSGSAYDEDFRDFLDDEEGEDETESTMLELTSRDEITLDVGKTCTLEYDVYPDQTVTFSSDNEKVATVSDDGVVVGIRSGWAVVTLTAEDGTTVECSINVVLHATQIKVNKTRLILKTGKKATLKAAIAPSNASKEFKTIKWTSSNTRVATVDSNGVVRAKKAGAATITASNISGLKATCKVIVKAKD